MGAGADAAAGPAAPDNAAGGAAVGGKVVDEGTATGGARPGATVGHAPEDPVEPAFPTGLFGGVATGDADTP
jgi:hypothetical protein